MRAVILAAGKGTRLRPYTEGLPKGMLEFAGKPLIEHQIGTLRRNGISDIVIVTGYAREKITFDVRYAHNPDYDTTNMVETLFCARDELEGDVLVCYADILYDDSVLNVVLESDADIGVVVDDDYWDYWTARCDDPASDIESMIIRDGRIVDLGRGDCSLEEAQQRYVGLIKFSASGIEVLKDTYDAHKNHVGPWLGSPSFKKAYMTSMLQAIIDSGFDVKPITISRGWLEFDTVEDYERANRWAEENSLSRFYSCNTADLRY
ncbi:MAG: NTP transferase domain-containing protein [Candidatus Woesearchaeota archaeon]